MERKIYNIGKLRYMITILFGKHRQIIEETIELKDEKGQVSSDSNPCDYIITMGKRVIIITEPNLSNPKMRLPYIVKLWKSMGNEQQPIYNRKMKFYIDNEGNNWVYTNDNAGELVSYIKDDNKIIHLKIKSKI